MDVALELCGLALEFSNLLGQLITGFGGVFFSDLLDFFTELGDGLFKFQNLFHGEDKEGG